MGNENPTFEENLQTAFNIEFGLWSEMKMSQGMGSSMFSGSSSGVSTNTTGVLQFVNSKTLSASIRQSGKNQLTSFYPKNGGALGGTWKREFLMPGQQIDMEEEEEEVSIFLHWEHVQK